MWSINDGRGNRIEGVEKKGKIHIYLYLMGNEYRRAIGIVDKVKRTWTIRKDPEKHLFRASGSYGFNREMVIRLKKDYKVIIKEPKTKIVRICFIKDIVEREEHLNFSKGGYELQLFYPRDKMDIEVL